MSKERRDDAMKRIAYFTIMVVMSSLVLVGCSLLPLSAEEKSYLEDCNKVKVNLNQYMKIQDKFYEAEYEDDRFGWQSWSGSYPVTNAGQDSRDSASKSIKSEFPWVYSISNSFLQNKSKEDFLAKGWSSYELEATVYQAFFQMLAKGSDIKVTVDQLKMIDSNFYDLDFNNVFGLFTPSERFKNCDDALDLKDDESFDSLSSDYGLYGSKGVRLATVLDVSISIWGCETFGIGSVDYGKGWRKCAEEDFKDTYVYTPSTEPTEEEKEILAEREADAEREAQNPSSSVQTSNVTPGQICSDIGQMVETKNYGSLTCKIVFLNRIKALVWMRS